MPVLYVILSGTGKGSEGPLKRWREAKSALLGAAHTIIDEAYMKPLQRGGSVCDCGRIAAKACFFY
jgi:hypothetical protein